MVWLAKGLHQFLNNFLIMYKIYYPKKDNATEFYLRIIENAIKRIGDNVKYINDFEEINGDDTVITIDAYPFFKSRKKHPKKIINWFQGITPEERLRFDSRNKLLRVLLYIIHSWLENYVLKNADLCFFVSNSMLEHYRQKYRYKKHNYFVMPCFNSKLEDSAFKDDKYAKPTFLYSGSMSAWQRVPETIALFKRIKETMIPNAELFLFTSDQDTAKKILREQHVDATVKYVHYTQLSEEIKKCKYGFLIREDVDVNNVATPTKMNSYLANGIIPVYSNVIGDFKEELKNLHYAVPVGHNCDGIEKICDIENKKIIGNDVMKDFSLVFAKYYNEEYYIKIISQILKQL